MKNIYQLLFGLTITFSSFSQTIKNSIENYHSEIASGYTDSIIKNLDYVEDGINFCVIGDWGRHGQFYQKRVAHQLGTASLGIDADFIVSTGDNFYPSGVKSVQDPSWKSSFEDVYTHHSSYIDWYVVLGNHDYRTNPQAEIDYSGISARWKMPSKYYSLHKSINNESQQTVGFYFLDSSPFIKQYYSREDELMRQNVMESDTVEQLKWLRSELKKSKDTWKVVVAHHPIYTAGKRYGQINEMSGSIRRLLNEFKVDLLITGHEHQLEFDNPKEKDTFYQIISGAGSEVRKINSKAKTEFAKSEFGFATIGMSEQQLLIQFVDWQGNVIFKKIIDKN